MSILILRGLLLALEALAISALLPLLAWTTGILLRRNAAMRHLMWLAAFGVLLALPLLALMAPPRMLMLQQAAPVPVDFAMAAPVAATYAQSWSVEAIVAVAAAPLCAFWLLGVAWNLLRLSLGAHGLMRLRRSSAPFERATHGDCEVRLGDGGPLTFGLRRPLIILPYDAPRWSRERLDAVLRHELAHVRRHDSATQWLAALACAFYWPNPLVWLGARAMRRDAEMAADDMVLAGGVQPSVYAAELVRLAAEAQLPNRFAVAMATPSSLEARVTSVLSPTPSRAGVTAMDALKLGLLGGACAIALAFARPDIALAQANPAPVTAAPLPAPADAPAPAQSDDSVARDNHHDMTPAEREQVRQARAQARAAREAAHEKAAAAREQALEQADAARERARDIADAAREKALDQADAAREQAREQAEAAREQAAAIRVDAHVTEKAWHEASRQIQQAVQQAMAEVRPYIREAARDPAMGEEIGHKVSEAMAKVQPRIDAAIARANVAVHVRVDAVTPVPPSAPLPPAPAQ